MPVKAPKDVVIGACTCHRAVGRIHIALTIVNRGDRPCFVIPRVRRVVMDNDTRTLSVWFSAGARGSGDRRQMRTEFTAPKTQAIPENSERVLIAQLSEDMTRLVPHDDGSFHLEAIDLRKATTVAVHAAVDDKPFYFSPERKDYARQVREWGRPLSARAKIKPADASQAR
jgi:hypothetical protein